MNEQAKETFFDDEFFSLTLMATVQRADAYVPNDTPERKRKIDLFQASLRSSLETMASEYVAVVSEKKHFENIDSISKNLSRDHMGALRGGEFRIGLAQKALNLHLKYRWCRGLIPRPPHCPFDSQIIKKLPGCRKISWTRLNSIDVYRTLVDAAREAAKKDDYSSIAEWELATYNELRRKGGPRPIGDKRIRAIRIIESMAGKHHRRDILDALTDELQCSRVNAAYYYDRVYKQRQKTVSEDSSGYVPLRAVDFHSKTKLRHLI